MTDTNKTEQESIGLSENVMLEGMTVLDISDDNSLRFVQRVLEGCAAEQDKMAARDMIIATSTRMRKPANI
jgi:hypothetical protein